MLAPCCAAEVHTARAAASVAPATSAVASCIPAKTGSSSVPSPNISSARAAWPLRRPAGALPASLTMEM
jgi:hypothetical protein